MYVILEKGFYALHKDAILQDSPPEQCVYNRIRLEIAYTREGISLDEKVNKVWFSYPN
jgi:hypothetical protein